MKQLLPYTLFIIILFFIPGCSGEKPEDSIWVSRNIYEEEGISYQTDIYMTLANGREVSGYVWRGTAYTNDLKEGETPLYFGEIDQDSFFEGTYKHISLYIYITIGSKEYKLLLKDKELIGEKYTFINIPL